MPWKNEEVAGEDTDDDQPAERDPEPSRRHIPTAAAPTKPSVRMNGAVTVIALKSDQVADARAT